MRRLLHKVRTVRRAMYRAYFSTAPMGTVMEKYWYLSRQEIFVAGFRAGVESERKNQYEH